MKYDIRIYKHPYDYGLREFKYDHDAFEFYKFNCLNNNNYKVELYEIIYSKEILHGTNVTVGNAYLISSYNNMNHFIRGKNKNV
jgi:hypothetical protein